MQFHAYIATVYIAGIVRKIVLSGTVINNSHPGFKPDIGRTFVPE